MALAKFKRILPPLPAPEVMNQIYERMLETLMDTPQDKWDDYLEEPREPLEPPSEFVENVCPECGGLRTAAGVPFDVSMRSKFGHELSCSRWRRWFRYKDVRNGFLI